MTPEANLAHLSALLDKNHKAPSNNKYPEARQFVSHLIRVPASRVYITYISKAGNFSVRVGQSESALRSDVVIALIERRDEDQATHRAARRTAERTGKPLFLLQTVSDESTDWKVIGGYALNIDPRGQRLLERLTDDFGGPAHESVEVGEQIAALEAVEYLEGRGLTGSLIGSALSRWHDVRSMVASAASSQAGLSAAENAVIARRRKIIAELKSMVADPSTTETQLHKKIRDNYWIFGGRYTGVADRDSLMPMDIYDIPLFCADGSLHIVELKGSYIPKLVVRHRSHLIPGEAVHEAVGQAMNYLRQLDEGGATMETLYKKSGMDYDLRRVRATVVIGNPEYVSIPADPKKKLGPVSRPMIDQTIRTYNTLINRVEVLTWVDLLDAADRSLQFEEEIAGGQSTDEAGQPQGDDSTASEDGSGAAEEDETIF
ncbi:Shedu anti-phage system protein SduA domain-containing protein [Streptomyces antibioticus]